VNSSIMSYVFYLVIVVGVVLGICLIIAILYAIAIICIFLSCSFVKSIKGIF
jgi:hypothetical protein